MQKFANDNNFYESVYRLGGKYVSSSFLETHIKNPLLRQEVLKLVNSLILINRTFLVSEDNLESKYFSYNMINKMFKNIKLVKTVINNFTKKMRIILMH